jgi:hypothetical protein
MKNTGTKFKIKVNKNTTSSTTDVLKRKFVQKVDYILIYLSKKGIKFHCEKCGNENGYTWKVWKKICDNAKVDYPPN